MSERTMHIMTLKKAEFKSELTRRGYGDQELNQLDLSWEKLCESASGESCGDLSVNGIIDLLTGKLSRIVGKDMFHCYIQEKIGFAVKDILEWKGGAPNYSDMYLIDTNRIPKATLQDSFYSVDVWECHLTELFDERDCGFHYNPGSVTMDDHGESISIRFEIY